MSLLFSRIFFQPEKNVFLITLNEVSDKNLSTGLHKKLSEGKGAKEGREFTGVPHQAKRDSSTKVTLRRKLQTSGSMDGIQHNTTNALRPFGMKLSNTSFMYFSAG